MIIVNRLENRSFGPFGSSTGFFLLIGGLILVFFSLSGLIIALIGAFVAFTSTSTIIDTENKRIKHADFLFGLLPFGKWIDIHSNMRLGLRKVKRGYLGYIRGTQPIDIQYEDIRIILYDSNDKQIMPVMKFKTLESAQAELKKLGSLLGLSNNLN